MFSSGLTKLTWGDPTWLDLERPHLPLLDAADPHRPRLVREPPAARRSSGSPCALMFAVELGLPFLIFAPRRPRRIALCGFLALQVLIAATGNYGFFNLLAIVLCVPLLDDRAWPASPAVAPSRRGRARERRSRGRAGVLVTVVATTVALVSIPPLVDAFHTGYWSRHPDNPILRLTAAASPFMLSNSYGLFRTMTTTRPEIEIEESEDGETWRAVAFRYKPGDPGRAPRFVAPHMPRLDWQMWFAALRAEGLAGRPRGDPHVAGRRGRLAGAAARRAPPAKSPRCWRSSGPRRSERSGRSTSAWCCGSTASPTAGATGGRASASVSWLGRWPFRDRPRAIHGRCCGAPSPLPFSSRWDWRRASSWRAFHRTSRRPSSPAATTGPTRC